MNKINVGGILFDNLNMSEAVETVFTRVREYDGRESTVDEDKLLLVANQDILNHIGKYKDLSLESLNKAFLTIPDGYSIVIGAKFLGFPLKERVTGPDLMEQVISKSGNYGVSNFFLGAAEGVAEKMASLFKEKYDDVIISGCYSPPFGDFTEEENDKIINMVNALKPSILWVSFGCPKQEWWIINNMKKLNVPIIAGVGAAFDFHSGNKKRAPVLWQKLRIEWLYRVLQEPGRLWKRYFNGGVTYLGILFRQKFGK